MSTETDPYDTITDAATNQVLTFVLGEDVFAVEVVQVREILDIVPVTRVPNADPFAPWLINVRGEVVPLLDLRHRFGLPRAEHGQMSRTVVLDVAVGASPVRVAIRADSVRDVLPLGHLSMEDLPQIGSGWSQDFVKGITHLDGELTIVLDLERVFTSANTVMNVDTERETA